MRAKVVFASLAIFAGTADFKGRFTGNAVAYLDVCHAGTYFRNDAGKFMTDGQPFGIDVVVAFISVNITAANANILYLNYS